MKGERLFVSWSIQHGRSRDLAAALGAEPVFIGIRRRRQRWLTPLRYLASTVATIKLFVTRRPAAIFVMVPPVPLTILALTYGRLARVPVCLDAHTGAVLGMRSGRRRISLRLLARFATMTIVTNSQLADPLKADGIATVILHDALSPQTELADRTDPTTFTVVAPLSWAPDEPIDDILAAAQRCPDVPFVATGRAPASVRERRDLPANLELVGFVDDAAFGALMANAGAVLALTTRQATMQQAGYEAMALGRPVVASDTRVLREFFGAAALYGRNADELASAVRECRARQPELAAAMRLRRGEMRDEFARGIAEINDAMRRPHPA